MVIKLKESTQDERYEKRMKIAALISKNNKGEQDAIEGYQALLSIIGDEDQDAVDTINEIISDEKNHSERLNALAERYDDVKPNKN